MRKSRYAMQHTSCYACYGLRGGESLILRVAALIFCADVAYRGFEVNGQVVKPIEANSPPSSATATKGSSVWLHWNYTYFGDGAHPGPLFTTITNYSEQVIGFNIPLQILAKRIGQNGALTLESPVPSPFNARVEVISSNSTLVIHNLQYNDSAYQFSSNVKVYLDTGGVPALTTYNLRPAVHITVNGIPDFIEQLPSTLDVIEGSNLQLQVKMDGNPKPSADIRWPHLIGSSPVNVPSVQLYPFVYSSKYTLNNIDARYCGRVLQTTIKNIIGSSPVTAFTYVTVLLNLDMAFGLRAVKLAASKCVEVKWKKAESGACYVKYEVAFNDASGNYIHSWTGYNIGKVKICNLRAYSNITDVLLTVSFKLSSKTTTAKVSEAPIDTSAPAASGIPYSSSPGMTNTQPPRPVNTNGDSQGNCEEWISRDSAFIAVIVILIIIIIIISIVIIIQRRLHSAKSQKQTREVGQAQMHYMDLEIRSKEAESNYAKLQVEYEEVGQ